MCNMHGVSDCGRRPQTASCAPASIAHAPPLARCAASAVPMRPPTTHAPQRHWLMHLQLVLSFGPAGAPVVCSQGERRPASAAGPNDVEPLVSFVPGVAAALDACTLRVRIAVKAAAGLRGVGNRVQGEAGLGTLGLREAPSLATRTRHIIAAVRPHHGWELTCGRRRAGAALAASTCLQACRPRRPALLSPRAPWSHPNQQSPGDGAGDDF